MAKNYYNYIDGIHTLEEFREYQISVLHHLGYLTKRNKHLEPLVEYALKECQTETQIGNLLHDVKCGNETIEEMLVRKGYM